LAVLITQRPTPVEQLERGSEDAAVIAVAPVATLDERVIDVGVELGQDLLERNLSCVAPAPRSEPDSDHLATGRSSTELGKELLTALVPLVDEVKSSLSGEHARSEPATHPLDVASRDCRPRP